MVDESDTMVHLPIMGGLSYREIHAFIDGFYVGHEDSHKQHRYEKEKHYWRVGYLVGQAAAYFGDRYADAER
jgi:hypothetical protein